MDGEVLTMRLRLRPFTSNDLPALHAMWTDPAVGRWVGGTHTTLRESEEELRQHIDHQARHGFGFWAAEDRYTGELVGEVGLMLFEGRGPEVEVGWAFTSACWGRGYATEAAAAWLALGFEELLLDRIIAVVLPDNARSVRVCEKLGMRLEGSRDAYGAEHLLYALDER